MADPDEHPESQRQPIPVLPYAQPAALNMKTIRQLPAFEANLAAGKLEAAGISSFIADQNISGAHPLLFGEVRLQVSVADFEYAEEVLNAKPERLDGDDDDYVEEAYRCPKCHRKAVDFTPLSPAMLWARFGILALLLLPVLSRMLAALSLDGPLAKSLHEIESMFVILWVVLLGVLVFVVLTARRRKRCRDCGAEWGTEVSD